MRILFILEKRKKQKKKQKNDLRMKMADDIKVEIFTYRMTGI